MAFFLFASTNDKKSQPFGWRYSFICFGLLLMDYLTFVKHPLGFPFASSFCKDIGSVFRLPLWHTYHLRDRFRHRVLQVLLQGSWDLRDPELIGSFSFRNGSWFSPNLPLISSSSLSRFGFPPRDELCFLCSLRLP